MTSITKVDQIVAVIRQQLSRVERADSRIREQPAASRPPGGARAASQDLFALLGQRMRSIDRNDPDRGRKAFRLFLESVLLAELGESLMNDPQFYRLVDDVQRQMESDPRVAASIGEAIGQLLSGAP
jgi:hypothetical protein